MYVNKTITVWVITNWMSEGIRQIEVHRAPANCVYYTHPSGFKLYYYKDDWFETKEEAVAYVERIRQAKIQELENQLAILNSIEL